MDETTALRPALIVMSADVADAVRNAGGLIFDRARRGWQVTVLVPAGRDTRPLRILGAEIADLATPRDHHRQRRSALATSSALYANDRDIRSELKAALATKTTEVLLWGGLDQDGKAVAYQLSHAARAFKTQALIAAGLPIEPTEQVEHFGTRCSPDVLALEFDVAG